MASFTSTLFKGIIKPVLAKSGLVETKATSRFAPKPAPHEDSMGALLRFLLINAASVIGAKLMAEASEYVGDKLSQKRVHRETIGQKISDAPTLETRTCPKCGAFRVRGEDCACTKY